MAKKSFVKEILNRRVPQIIGSYFIAGTTAIFFIDWLINRYNLPDYYVSLCLFGLVSIIPTVIIISYFHGAPGKDEWTIIEKTIIPLNIIFIVISLLAGYKYEIWLYGFEEEAKNYIIHLSSNKENIDHYYRDSSDFFDKETYLIREVKELFLDSLQNSIVAKLNEDNFRSSMRIESSSSLNIKTFFNQFPHIRSSNYQNSELKIIEEELKREVYETYNFKLENEVIIFIYNIFERGDENENLGYFFEIHYLEQFKPVSYIFDYDILFDIKEVIETIVLKVDGAIYSKVIGDMNIGRIIELLGTDLVKIGFDKDDKGIKLIKGMTLVSPAKYYWQRDGMERRIEDYELAMDYINKHPSFLEKDDKYDFTAEQKQAFYSDSSIFKKDYLWALDAMSKDKNNRSGVSIWSTIYYGMQILDVNQEIGTLVAKVIWKYPPWVKVRIQDKVYIKGSFGIER